uniref:Ribonuclease H-like domain, reverse transcriptase, RNA-dependent DNA polymerase n=1 Tax=Tanacetum cinerariifolium TaxID=118510 RepID=A0A699KVR1_TANCI|nr:ribonuclease H-like domain, reverse transcriptase, RNA-dependent DNA polymerase [Tanacetum cinerariifolium]
MGYEKPTTKLTFYKAFFSSQWKFLIHTILQCMSTKRTSWNEFSSSMASAIICLSTGAASTTDDDVNAAVEEPFISSPPPPTQSPPPSQDIPSTSQDKIAQALEITKLKSRVKKLDRRNKASKLQRLKKVGTAQRIDTFNDIMMDDVSKQERMIADMDADIDVVLEDAKEVAVEKSSDVEESADIQGRTAESQAQIYQIDLEHANKVLSMQDDDDAEPVELQEVVEVVTTAKLIIEVVAAASTTLTVATP